MFSKACEYGIRAAIFIARESLEGERVSIGVVAKKINSPKAFTAKIMQKLSRNSIVESRRGPKGGFEVTEEQFERVRLIDIVEAIDGNKVYTGCGLGLKECNADHPCPVHDEFVSIRAELKKMLASTTLYELATKLELGNSFLKV